MTVGRTLLVAVALVCFATVVGTGAFSTADAERDVAIDVAADENAYLGVETHSPELPNGNHEDVELVTLSNHVPAGAIVVTVDVPASNGPPPVFAGVDESVTIPTGESETVTTDVTCGPERSEEVTVEIAATNRDDISVELDRTVTVACTGNSRATGLTKQNRSTANGSTATPVDP